MGKALFDEILNEVRPFCIHGACALIAVGVAYLMGLAIPKLEELYPQETVVFYYMRKGDVYTFLIAEWFFIGAFIFRLARVVCLGLWNWMKARPNL